MDAAVAYLRRAGIEVDEVYDKPYPGLHILAEDRGLTVAVMVRVVVPEHGATVEAEEEEREALMMDCDGRSIDRLDIIDIREVGLDRALLMHHRGIWADAGPYEEEEER